MKKYSQRPEVKIKYNEWMKEYRKRPHVRERYNAYMKKYNNSPQGRARKQTPEYKEYMKKYGKQYYILNRDHILQRNKKYQQKHQKKRYLQCSKNDGSYLFVKKHPNYNIDNYCAGCKIAVPKTLGLNCLNCGLRMRTANRLKKDVFRY